MWLIIKGIFMTLMSKLRSNPKLAVAAAILVALAAGYLTGRFAQPAKVITKTETKTEVQYKDRIVYKEAEARIVYRNVVRTVVVAKKPDGETTTTTTITDKSTDSTKLTATENVVATGVTKTDTLSMKTTYSQPHWNIRGFTTLQLSGPTKDFAPSKLDPLLLYGAAVDYRAWGPLWVGIAGGGSYDLRTRSQGWWVGPSLSLSFSF